ncbi:MAG: DeoR/GlpR transcriptional regulator [Sedimentisphaerales bacterium]|nr:DeoR/GlpR transcriptional regulator [Sedimentisphaerales bacterium]
MHDEKLQRILELLEQQAYWQSGALAEALGVSRSTIQRCIKELSASGLARRVHGGVRRNGGTISTAVPVDERLLRDHGAKESIAKEAVGLMPRSGSVYIDAGTTALPLTQQLENGSFEKVLFVTNGIALAQVFARLGLRHVLLSGAVHPVTQTISGPVTSNQLGDFNFDACFLSADAVDGEFGLTCSLLEEAMVKRRALERSERKILVAAMSKWGQRANSRIAAVSVLDDWVVETATAPIRRVCQQYKIRLHEAAKL